MRRTKMKRGTKGLRRGSKSLKRTPLERAASLSKGSTIKRGKRLRVVGKRGAEIRRTLKEMRVLVIGEQCGFCARCGLHCGDRLEIHHRKARSQHERGENPHARDNLVGLCPGPRGCHALVERHLVPDWSKWKLSRKGAQHA